MCMWSASAVDKADELVVPDHDVGWYNVSAKPGQGENIVLWGPCPALPADTADPRAIRAAQGATCRRAADTHDGQGAAHVYTITRQVEARPNEVSYILPKGREMVTMVSCYGDSVIVGGEVVDMTSG